MNTVNVLRSLSILDIPPELAFDDLTRLTCYRCGWPIAFAVMAFLPSLRSLTAFLPKVGRPPTQVRPMGTNLGRKQGLWEENWQRYLDQNLRLDLGFHLFHVCYEVPNRLQTLRAYIRELDALALLIYPDDNTSSVNGHGGDWQLE